MFRKWGSVGRHTPFFPQRLQFSKIKNLNFKDIPGHRQLKDNLRDIVATGHIPHAIMLSGPTGTGKMMLARAFAQYLHCDSPEEGEPCGKCQNCRLHENLSHPDMHFVYPVIKSDRFKYPLSENYAEEWIRMLQEYPAMPQEKWPEILEAGNSQPVIYVNEADSIILADSYPPYTSQFKIFIIWLPERMNIETANKLLKVIEEPSESTLFILVSDNELQVLPTIFSRVQRFHAGRLSDSELAGYINQKFHLTPDQAMRLASICNGSLIKADELGTHSGENEEFLTVYQEIMRAAYAKRVAKLRQIADQVHGFGREKIRRFLDYMARMIRENFIYNMNQPTLTAMTLEEETFSKRFSPFINHLNVEDFASETDRAKRDIERNGNPKLILFDYFINCIILLQRK